MSTKTKARIQYAITTRSGRRCSALVDDRSSLKADKAKGQRISKYHDGHKISL